MGAPTVGEVQQGGKRVSTEEEVVEPIYTEYRDYKWWEGLFGNHAEERTVAERGAYFKYLTVHTPDGEVLVVVGPHRHDLRPAGEAE